MFAKRYFFDQFALIFTGILIISLICLSVSESGGAEEENDSNIINKVYDYTQCRTLVLNSSITIWYQGSAADPEDINLFINFTSSEEKQNLIYIKRAITRWGLNIDKWRKNISDKVKAQTSIQNVLYDKFAWVKAKELDSSNPLKSCTAKIRIDVELTSPVRVGGNLQIGRYYYFLQKDGTLTLRGPGSALGYPKLVSTRERETASYTSESETFNTINNLTLELTKDLIDALTIPKN
jgi:hypothetical protein